MFRENIYTAKTTIRLFLAAHFILFYLLFPYIAFSENLADELLSASKNGDAAEVKDLVAKGVNVNKKDEYGSTALIYAVTNNNSNCVKVLTENGADVNTKNISSHTPLTIASKD
jgi:ankyrin repeat protein